MSKHYNLDGIKTELNKKISEHKSIIAAWENVTFPTKKDGKPFATLSKNIVGATLRNKEYTLQPCKELFVCVWDEFNGYVTDTIDCYELVKRLTDENKLAKTQNYAPKQSYLEQHYNFDLDDIKHAICERLDYKKARLETLEKELFILDEAYTNFKNGYSKLLETLRKDVATAGNVGFSEGTNDIYYMIKDTILDRFPYC